MRKLDISNIGNTTGMPIKGGTLEHLQLAYQEVLNAVAQNLIGKSMDATKCYILYGCVNSGAGQVYNISAGAVFFNGEVYLVDAASFTAPAGQVAVATIVTTQYVTNADPVLFTNGNTYNVHNIRKIQIAAGLAGSGVCDYSAFLETCYIVKSETVANLGAAYTVKFDQDRAIFFSAATVNNTISFDLTRAVPGVVVRLKFAMGAGVSLTIASQAGITPIIEGLPLASATNANSVLYFMYLGKNAAGNDEIAVNLKTY